MAHGYLATAGRMNWVPREGWFDAAIFKGETVLGNTDLLGRTAGHLEGWRCVNCLLMLLQYGT